MNEKLFQLFNYNEIAEKQGRNIKEVGLNLKNVDKWIDAGAVLCETAADNIHLNYIAVLSNKVYRIDGRNQNILYPEEIEKALWEEYKIEAKCEKTFGFPEELENA